MLFYPVMKSLFEARLAAPPFLQATILGIYCVGIIAVGRRSNATLRRNATFGHLRLLKLIVVGLVLLLAFGSLTWTLVIHCLFLVIGWRLWRRKLVLEDECLCVVDFRSSSCIPLEEIASTTLDTVDSDGEEVEGDLKIFERSGASRALAGFDMSARWLTLASEPLKLVGCATARVGDIQSRQMHRHLLTGIALVLAEAGKLLFFHARV
jgi:hypothetical protein